MMDITTKSWWFQMAPEYRKTIAFLTMLISWTV
jgi:hypothetical protein